MAIPNNPEVDAMLTHGAALMAKQITETKTYSLEGEKYWMEEVQHFCTKMYRIFANRDIPLHGVKKGDEGGMIQHPRNLSQNGECWIAKGSTVEKHATVRHSALVGRGSFISDHAAIQGSAKVLDAVVEGNAIVCDESVITGHWEYRVEIRDNVQVFGTSRIEGWTTLRGSVILESATVLQAHITGNAILRPGAFIRTNEEWISFGGVGSENGTLTAYPQEDGTILCNRGCFNGTLEQFETKMLSRHPKMSPYRSEYKLLIAVIKSKLHPERHVLAKAAAAAEIATNEAIYRP